MSAQLITASPRRINATHRRRRRIASGQSVQRYYDPQIGRFLFVDPVTANGSTGGNFNRYWYANNNPYRFVDPDGRYICSSGKQNCADVKSSLADTRNAMNALPAGSKERIQLRSVLTFYGKEGVDNGVTVRSGSANGAAGNAITEGDRTTVTINFKGIAAVTGGAGNSTYGAYVRNTVAHEGSHGVDQSKVGMPTTRGMLERTELRAYRVEADVARGLGQSHIQGYWTVDGRYNKEEILKGAQDSVNQTCAGGGC